MSEPTYRIGLVQPVDLPVAGEPPEGDVFEMVDDPNDDTPIDVPRDPARGTSEQDVQDYLRTRHEAVSPGARQRAQREAELAVQAEDAEAAKALEIRADYEQGPDVINYKYVSAFNDGRLPPKGALAEQFDPAYSIVHDNRSADEVASEVALPGLLYDMGVRPTEIEVGGVKTPTPIEAWAGAQGIGEQMTGRLMVNTMTGLTNKFINFVRDTVDNRGGVGETPPDLIPEIGAVGELAAPGTAERVISFMAQLAIGNVMLSRATGLKVAGTLARETTAALLTEAIINDPRSEFGGNFAPMIMEYFDLGDQELRDSLDSTQQKSALVGRVIQMLEAGALIGTVAGAPVLKNLAEGIVDGLGQHIASLPTPANYQGGKVTYHVPKPKKGTAQTVSTRVPSAKKPKEKGGTIEDPSTHLLRTGSDAMAAGGTLDKGIASFNNVATSFKPLRGRQFTAEEKLAHLTRGMADNLLWLHDLFKPELRSMATRWYPGANKLARGMGKQYGTTTEQASGVMAVLSPQKDWFMNMDQANRVMRAYQAAQKSGWQSNPRMTAWGKQFAKKSLDGWTKTINKKLKEGKITAEEHATFAAAHQKAYKTKLKQFSFKTPPVTDLEKARWVRAFDESSFDRGYNVLSPEGNIIGPATKKPNKKGFAAPAKSAWGSFSAIKKAVMILEDGSMTNITKQLGKEHKVRNFYNNIAHPEDPTNVTIDTHAVAAALLRGLSGASLEVIQNFGGRGVSSSAHTGANGTYGIYHDAYNLAASERGISPREMQSITWEAVRGLFTATQKSAGVDDKIKKIWRRVQQEKISREEGLAEVLDLVDGIDDPAWAKVVK